MKDLHWVVYQNKNSPNISHAKDKCPRVIHICIKIGAYTHTITRSNPPEQVVHSLQSSLTNNTHFPDPSMRPQRFDLYNGESPGKDFNFIITPQTVTIEDSLDLRGGGCF